MNMYYIVQVVDCYDMQFMCLKGKDYVFRMVYKY